jgi:hypothetical protein
MMVWARRCATLVLGVGILLAIVGCDTGTPSALNPDESVLVHGRLVGADGKPVKRTRVALYRQAGVEEAFGGAFVILASAGIACLADNAPQVCHSPRQTLTADDGTFSYSLKGSDTYEGGSHNAATFNLSAALPPHGDQLTGPDTTQTFRIRVTDLKLPAVAFWQPAISYSGAGASGRLTYGAIAPALGDAPVFEAEFEDPAGNLVWAFAGLHSPATIDARLLEDHDGGVAVHARPHQGGTGTVFNFDYRSPSVIYRGSAGAPLSRQRACYIPVTGRDPVRQRPCRLTDGDIATLFEPQTGCAETAGGTPCPVTGRNTPYIDLGAPASIDLVAIHGCKSGCLLDTSLDGQHWSPTGGRALTDGPAPNGLAAIPVTAGTHARYIRANITDTSRLTEISVWGPPGQQLPPPTEPAVAPPRSISTGGHPAQVGLSDSQFRGLVLLNIFGLLVIGAVAVLLLRRRRVRPSPR